jgi:hypothetical protein
MAVDSGLKMPLAGIMLPKLLQALATPLRVKSPFALCCQAGRTMAVNSGLKTLLAGIMRDVAALQPAEATGAMSAVAEAAVAEFQVRSALLCNGNTFPLEVSSVVSGCRLCLVTFVLSRCVSPTLSWQLTCGRLDLHLGTFPRRDGVDMHAVCAAGWGPAALCTDGGGAQAGGAAAAAGARPPLLQGVAR